MNRRTVVNRGSKCTVRRRQVVSTGVYAPQQHGSHCRTRIRSLNLGALWPQRIRNGSHQHGFGRLLEMHIVSREESISIMISSYRCVVAILLLFVCASEAAKICRSTSIPFHTWVHMDYRCSDAGSACTSSTPWTQLNDIGYENGNGGTLRDESKNPGGVYVACHSRIEKI